jgi:protein-disulfide isomerase
MSRANRSKRAQHAAALRSASAACRTPRPRTQFAAAAAVALTIAALAVVGNLSSRPAPPPAKLAGAAGVATLLQGIPQHGHSLGRADAPLTLAVYVDPQCPYCATWDTRTMPTLVARYVRPGMLKIEFRGLAFLGADSLRGLQALQAAGLQDNLFQTEMLLFENQGTENTSWISERFVAQLAASFPAIDPARFAADRSGSAVAAAIATAQAQADAAGLKGTPSLYLGVSGGPLEELVLRALDPSGTTPAIDAALKAAS